MPNLFIGNKEAKVLTGLGFTLLQAMIYLTLGNLESCPSASKRQGNIRINNELRSSHSRKRITVTMHYIRKSRVSIDIFTIGQTFVPKSYLIRGVLSKNN